MADGRWQMDVRIPLTTYQEQRNSMPTHLARIARVGAVCIGFAAVAGLPSAHAQVAPTKTFSSGQLLTAEEFKKEQLYVGGERGAATAFGQVTGLAVAVDGDGIKIAPGFAVTPFGERVVLPSLQRLDTPVVDGKRYAVVCAVLRDVGRRCLLLAVVERSHGTLRVTRP